MSEEIFDVVDDADRVIRQAPRSVVHAQNLLHRAVSIFVLKSDGRLLLQLRSDSKDQYPGCYTSSASGHVDSGEDYETAAIGKIVVMVSYDRLGITPGENNDQARIDLADTVTRAIAMYENTQPAAFLGLPVRIQ